ncbi:MAG: polyprenyl synthetase family protein, partial [Acidobacteriota bacterium]
MSSTPQSQPEPVQLLLSDIQQRLAEFPELGQWPELERLVGRKLSGGRPCWEFTVDACRAVGGERADAAPGAAVVFGLFYSIHLVDDLLDEDPKGVYHRVGVGPAANMALALQSAASRLLGSCGLSPEAECLAHRALGQAGWGTAFGQMLDHQDFPGEEAYWRMVGHKTPPLFSFALLLGSLVGGASVEKAQQLARLGALLGEIVQISDDLGDAMEQPAAPDWRRQATNLPILFATTAEHAEREAFEALLKRVDEPEALAEAQAILVRSGAFSFCAYRLIQAHRKAAGEIKALDLVRPAALLDLF